MPILNSEIEKIDTMPTENAKVTLEHIYTAVAVTSTEK